MDVADRFGANLRRIRNRSGLSQEQLGRRADLHRTAIGLLEKGARTPRIDTLLKLAQGLPAEIDDLLEGITWEPGDASPGQFTLSSELPSDHA
jgi:transcriptional regulator with XRE-family HTH domain